MLQVWVGSDEHFPELCSLRVGGKEDQPMPTEITGLLVEFQSLFKEVSSLSPARGHFDHQIPEETLQGSI